MTWKPATLDSVDWRQVAYAVLCVIGLVIFAGIFFYTVYPILDSVRLMIFGLLGRAI